MQVLDMIDWTKDPRSADLPTFLALHSSFITSACSRYDHLTDAIIDSALESQIIHRYGENDQLAETGKKSSS